MKILVLISVLAGILLAEPTETFLNEKESSSKDTLYDYCYRKFKFEDLDVKYIQEYLDKLTYEELYEEKNLKFLFDFMIYDDKLTLPIGSESFDFVCSNWKKLSKFIDEYQAELRYILLLRDWREYAIKKGDKDLFVKVNRKFQEHCKVDIGYAFEFTDKSHGINGYYFQESAEHALLVFYKENEERENYKKMMAEIKDDVWDDHKKLNNIVFMLLNSESTKNDLKVYKKWIERSIELDKNFLNLETYAKVLNEQGDHASAKRYADEALNLTMKEHQSLIKVIIKQLDIKDLIKEINKNLAQK